MSGPVDVLAVLRQMRSNSYRWDHHQEGAAHAADKSAEADEAIAVVIELIEANRRTIAAFEGLSRARGVAANHFARRECEQAVLAQKAAIANVGGDAKLPAWDRELGRVGGAE